MTANDDLADYNSEEDEDYVPDDVQDEAQWTGAAAGGARSAGVGKKRKAFALGIEQPTRVPMAKGGGKKRKGQRRVGAAVLSDEDDDPFQQPAAAQPQPQPQPAPHTASSASERLSAHSSANGHQHQAADSGTAEEGGGVAAAVPTAEAPTLPADALPATALPAIPAVSATPPVQAASASSSTSSTSQSSSSPPAAAPPAKKGGEDLARLLAQFNKKSSRQPVVKKVINQWELPVKPKQLQPAPAAAAAPSQQPPAASPELPASASPPPSSSSADRLLSDEQTQVTEYTSFAGQALQSADTQTLPLQLICATATALRCIRPDLRPVLFVLNVRRVTKTLIRGSAEEAAHRQRAGDSLSALVASLGSKRGINTLEKSRLDWTASKQEEGDEAALAAFVDSKEAVVEQMAFLQRTERRQWEKQKEARDESRKLQANSSGLSLAGIDDD